MLRLLMVCAMTCLLSGAVVIDRIAVVVNRRPLKASEVERDVRVIAFLNNEKPRQDASSEKAAAERLIDQTIIRDEIASGGYPRATQAEADALLNNIRKERFGGSEVRLRQALASYGLTEETLRAQLLWQLTVLRFIDERFRAGLMVTDEEVRSYYDQHRANFQGTFDSAAPAIRKALEGEQVNKQFEEWLAGARKNASIQYREDSLK